MRTLSLIRHAKSSWDYPELSDFERPLNERGRRDAPRMAKHFAQEHPSGLRLVSSPALRAITTAQTFAEALGQAHTEIQLQARIYDASLKTLLRVVQEHDDADAHVALFGHNPGFSQLAQHLSACPFDEMPTCAIVTLELPLRRWADAAAGCGKLLSYLTPKTLQA